MSDLTNLQAAAAGYREDVRRARLLRELQATPAWKAVIAEGFEQGLASQLVSELSIASEEARQLLLNKLTGISAFKQYLELVAARGEYAAQGIAECEAALLELETTEYED